MDTDPQPHPASPTGAAHVDYESPEDAHRTYGPELWANTVAEVVDPDLSESYQIQEEDSDERIMAKLKLQGVRVGAMGVAPAVFWPALTVILGVAILAIAFPDAVGSVLTTTNDWIVGTLGWYYMLVIGLFILFSVGVGLSRYGKITLGREGEKPEFGMLSWFSMLFAAGMGIGLVFYGVGEPLSYATFDPKPGWPTDEQTLQRLAMAQTFVHWGVHPWSIYAVIGLGLAYAIHRRGRPISIRWALEPLFGQRVKGWMGDVIDILAIFGTVFGIATSLGLGVNQIAAGMQAVGIVETADLVLLITLIVGITLIAILSVVSGVGRGIKWLSNINLGMAGLVLLTVLLLGPTLVLMKTYVESLGVYLANFFEMTFDSAAHTGEEGDTWNSAWTIFYWGWWISWAPFVGVFIARISRGRTVREFILGVLLVPSLVGFLWFTVMGGSGLYRQFDSGDPIVGEGEEVAAEAALFDVLGALPMGEILSFIAIILVAIFFITSSDSGSLVVDMLASGGHPNPPVWSRILWAVLEGLIAIGLLWAGGLGALQAAALATALPFSLVLLGVAVATLRALKIDDAYTQHGEFVDRYTQLRADLQENFSDHFGPQVDDRIDYRLSNQRQRWHVAKPEPPVSGRARPEP